MKYLLSLVLLFIILVAPNAQVLPLTGNTQQNGQYTPVGPVNRSGKIYVYNTTTKIYDAITPDSLIDINAGNTSPIFIKAKNGQLWRDSVKGVTFTKISQKRWQPDIGINADTAQYINSVGDTISSPLSWKTNNTNYIKNINGNWTPVLDIQKAANIATLRTIKGIRQGSVIHLQGYYIEGDGGAQNLYWDSLNVSADNGGTIFQVTGVSTGRWKSVNTNNINALTWGLSNNGITDNLTLMQKLLIYAGGGNVALTDSATDVSSQTSGGYSDSYVATNTKSIYFPTGKYVFSNTIFIPANIKIYGDGRSSVFVFSNNSSCIKFARPNTDGFANGTILENFYIYGNAGGSQIGIEATYTSNIVLNNVFVENTYTAIKLGVQTIVANVNNCRSRNTSYGLILDALSTSNNKLSTVSNNINGGFYNGSIVSIYLRLAENTKLNNVGQQGYLTSTGIKIEGCENVTFSNVYCEINDIYLDINNDPITGSLTKNVQITGGDWQGSVGNHIRIISNNDLNTKISNINFSPVKNSNISTGLHTIIIGKNSRNFTIVGDLSVFGVYDSSGTAKWNNELYTAFDQSTIKKRNLLASASTEDLTNAAWTNSGATITIDGTQTPPFTGMSVSKVVFSVINNFVSQSVTSVSKDSLYTFSFWARSDTNTIIQPKLTVPGVSDETFKYITLTKKWRRYFITSELKGLINNNISCLISAVTGQTIYITGVQLEQGGASDYDAVLPTNWTIAGNKKTTTGNNFIGTTDAVDFITKTNNSEVTRVTSSGNFGVGTNNPSEKIEANGNIKAKSTSANAALYADYNGTNRARLIASSNGSVYFGVDIGLGDLAIGTSNYNKIAIQGSTGNVYLGATSGYNNVEAIGAGSSPQFMIRNSTISGNHGLYFQSNNDLTHRNWLIGTKVNNNGFEITQSAAAGTQTFNTPVFSLAEVTGYAGFNTSTALYRIDIDANTASTGNPIRLAGLQVGATTDSIITSQSGVLKRMDLPTLNATLSQSGNTSITAIATGATGTATITFSPTFTTVPNIVVSPNVNVGCYITAVSTSNATITCTNNTVGALTPSAVYWIARK